jgi:hypothetical protein
VYAKLFSQILDSTVWREADHVLRVWLTFLLVCDKEGFVRMSIPGLADRAKVSLQLCEAALQRLEAPDPYSQSKEEDGARIIRIGENGEPLWQIVNYERYRAMKDADHERERWKEKKARQRARKRANCPPRVPPLSPHVHPIVDADALKNKDMSLSSDGSRSRKRNSYPEEYETLWLIHPFGSKSDGLREYHKAKKDGLPPDEELQTILHRQAEYAKGSTRDDFRPSLPHISKWIKTRRWETPLPAARTAGRNANLYKDAVVTR